MHYIDQFLSEQYISQAIRLKAKNIYSEDQYKLINFDQKTERALYTVKSDNGDGDYTVEVTSFNSPAIKAKCNCPSVSFCTHALTVLNDLRMRADELPTKKFNQEETYVNGDQIISNVLSGHYTNTIDLKQANLLFRNHKVIINQAKDSVVNASVSDKDFTYLVVLSENTDRNIKTSCRCRHTDSALCPHKVATFLQLESEYGRNPFKKIRNYDAEKDALLQQYGYNLKDDLEGLFNFSLENGNLQLLVLDPSLEKTGVYAEWKKKASIFLDHKKNIFLDKKGADQVIAYVWEYPDSFHLRQAVKVSTIFGKRKSNGNIGAPLRRVTSENMEDVNLSQAALGIYQILKHLDYEDFIADELKELSNSPQEYKEPDKFLEHERAHQIIGNVFDQLSKNSNFLIKEYGNLTLKDLHPISLNQETPEISFTVSKLKGFYELTVNIQIEGEYLEWEDMVPIGFGFMLKASTSEIFMFHSNDARTMFYFFGKKSIKVKTSDYKNFYNDFIIPLMKKHNVDFNAVKVDIEDLEGTAQSKLYVKEMDNFLLLIPAFIYEYEDLSTEVEMDSGEAVFFDYKGKKIRIIRDKKGETAAKNFLMELHPDFETQLNRHYFYLPIDEILKSNWFFQAFEKIQNENIQVLGLKSLSKIKYNPFRPKMLMKAGSGTDWFDLSVQVSFGEQEVRLQDIRKAILNNDQYVRLGDGTLGILPEEWLKKYSAMFRAAKIKTDTLQLSKFQYPAIELFYQEIDNHQLLEELYQKIERLKSFREIKQVPIPKNVNAELRAYQKEGFNWLKFLQEYGWGGCLADDMGLGKTLQVLTFIQSLVNDDKDTTVLVVVPRSLVFNWQNEAKKFCPELSILEYSGGSREKDHSEFQKHHIVLTTYSLVRNDIEILKSFKFDYVILDESQAIKNPTSLISKAVKLLSTDNRLIMTGTPVENNTFDLYSQMDFLNPGMLGSMDYFRKEYANKIDRDRDKDKAQELQRLINPFILSRKKEEVAKELPEKTETVIYCELGAKQRKTYDYFKNKYYEKIKAVIAQEGIGKSGMHVLQGLLKLRQICNSTALIKEEGDFGHESVKMEILMDEIVQVTTHNGKALVFSYFVEMLDIIKANLEKQGIGYSYLSGSSTNREKIVDDFKSKSENQVFLISLKAGGFGLNLTEANYVFMVDPWWNPAVEQQAIDRTHRIGQDQKVFAYKLICRNTIEEKILELQEKKRAVAKDIINVEAGFMKKLKEEDLKALFS